MWNENYLFGNAPQYKDMVKFDEKLPKYQREYSSDGISDIIKTAVDKGFFVTYNHPTWSRESYPQYMGYNGMNAFEIFNGSCITMGYEDYNPRVYDDLLSKGEKLYCIGADDNHNGADDDSRYSDSGVAFTVIKAEKLEYNCITKALENGNFYASEGPEIYSLWYEDGKIHIECSEADKILCIYKCRKAGVVMADKGLSLNKASFDVDINDGYVRITVVDKCGRHACTNAYFCNELCEVEKI